MLKDLNFVCFDFETTGLNIKKDEPIQIGILRFDKNFNIIDQFESNIKPTQKKEELNSIVNFVTGLNTEDINNSPYIDELLPRISEFFDENSIIIGHNISFDIAILEKYLKFNFLDHIDTFILSRTIFHFLPSYSLEVISQYINEEQEEINSHNALADSYSSFKIFKKFIYELEALQKNYPILISSINKSKGIYKKCLDISKYQENTKTQLFLPPIKKERKDKSKILNKQNFDIDKLEQFKKIYIGNIDIKQALNDIGIGNKKYILAFSSYSKMKLFKNYLYNFGVKDIGYLSEDLIFDNDKIKQFMNKKTFEDFEINFLIKYFSQYDKGHGVLDINSVEDYKIFNFLKKNADKKLSNTIITTHQNIYKNIKDKQDLSSYNILFFDHDRWYASFSKYINKPLDLYEIINSIENILYKIYTQNGNYTIIEQFYNYFLILTGVIYSEITNKFKNTEHNKIEINPVIDNIDFPQTNQLLIYFNTNFAYLKEHISNDDYKLLNNIFKEFQETINNIFLAEKRMYEEDKFYFVFYKTNNIINYQEFLNFLKDYNINFVTNMTTRNAIKLENKEERNEAIEQNINLLETKDAKKIKSYIKTNANIFILSTVKNESKNIFEYLISNNFHKDYCVQAENITGGMGKSMFYIKKENKNISIGGFDFLFNLFAEGIYFDIIIIYHIPGPLQLHIKNDIKYYSNLINAT